MMKTQDAPPATEKQKAPRDFTIKCIYTRTTVSGLMIQNWAFCPITSVFLFSFLHYCCGRVPTKLPVLFRCGECRGSSCSVKVVLTKQQFIEVLQKLVWIKGSKWSERWLLMNLQLKVWASFTETRDLIEVPTFSACEPLLEWLSQIVRPIIIIIPLRLNSRLRSTYWAPWFKWFRTNISWYYSSQSAS